MLVRRMEKLEKITCISTLSAVKEERLPYGCEWHWRRPGWATPCRQRDEDRTEEGSKSETGSHVDILLCAHPTITLVERTGIARATPRTPRTEGEQHVELDQVAGILPAGSADGGAPNMSTTPCILDS